MKDTYTIIQHTPLVHFLAEQEPEPALRESEVGPKLDKFLYDLWLKKLGNCEIKVFEKYGHCIKGYNKSKFDEICNIKDQDKKLNTIKAIHWHLDYKLEINPTNDIEVKQEEIINATKKTVFATALELVVKSFNTTLKNEIKKNLKAFFILHSFGYRSNKGYGNFYLVGTTWEEVIDTIPVGSFYKVGFFSNIQDKSTNVKEINSKVYNKLKRTELLKNIPKNDKEWIKAKLNRRTVEDENFAFARVLLGLANNYEIIGKTIIPVHDDSNAEQKIERFKSPLTFKVFDKNLFVLVNKIPKSIFNTEFIFKQNDSVLGTLLTPKEFDLNDFCSNTLPTLRFTQKQ